MDAVWSVYRYFGVSFRRPNVGAALPSLFWVRFDTNLFFVGLNRDQCCWCGINGNFMSSICHLPEVFLLTLVEETSFYYFDDVCGV